MRTDTLLLVSFHKRFIALMHQELSCFDFLKKELQVFKFHNLGMFLVVTLMASF